MRFVQDAPGRFRIADYTVLNGNHGLVYLLPTIDGTYGMFLERHVELGACRRPRGRLSC